MYIYIECDNRVCATCSGDAITCGTDCNNGCERCETTAMCIGPTCKAGFWFNGSGVCLPCTNPKCLTCDN